MSAAAAVPWWRTGLGDALFDGRRLLLVVVALVAVQGGLRVLLAAPGTFSSRPAAALALTVLVLVAGGLVAASARTPRAAAGPVVLGAVLVLLAVDVVAVVLTAHVDVYGDGLFTVTGGGLAALALLAVRPLGPVVAAGSLHVLVLLGGSLLHDPDAPAVALARGAEVAAAAAAPVAAGAAYLHLVARLTQARRAAEAEAAAEEVRRRATAVADGEREARLEAARLEVGPLLERVVAGAGLPLGDDDVERATTASRRLRAHLLQGSRRTWLDEALSADPAGVGVPVPGGRGEGAPTPPVVVRAVSGGGDVPGVGRSGAADGRGGPDGLGPRERDALLALVRLARSHGGEVRATLLPGSAVLAVRGADELREDPLAEDLRAALAAGPWIAEEDGLLVLEVQARDAAEDGGEPR
ncbi:hypothetical protein WDZ17_15830 [Pseudokineococcus basanitobsidens]|uniref:Signal transduction histidine kinase n=1 Tax=Pseudokineococcus basanitobsidens TaxID=1926649 RepID=A0ABU8RNS2_9ACTN